MPDARAETPRTAGRAAMFLAWLVTAASILALLGIAAYTMRLQVRLADLQTRLSHALVRASMADRAMADARRAAAEAKAAVAVAASPDAVRIDLAGQAAAPRATGRAFVSAARGVTVAASNLPPLAEGMVYQVWIVTASGQTSAGFIVPDPDGFGSMPVTPIAEDGATGVIVTLEARGASAPAGPRVLIGASSKGPSR